MTDIEAKALALADELQAAGEHPCRAHLAFGKLLRDGAAALKAHEAFKQEVSDVAAMMLTEPHIKPSLQWALTKFIIPKPKPKPKPKPDPLLGIVEWLGGPVWGTREEYVKEIHKALDARGWEIREKGQ